MQVVNTLIHNIYTSETMELLAFFISTLCQYIETICV